MGMHLLVQIFNIWRVDLVPSRIKMSPALREANFSEDSARPSLVVLFKGVL